MKMVMNKQIANNKENNSQIHSIKDLLKKEKVLNDKTTFKDDIDYDYFLNHPLLKKIKLNQKRISDNAFLFQKYIEMDQKCSQNNGVCACNHQHILFYEYCGQLMKGYTNLCPYEKENWIYLRYKKYFLYHSLINDQDIFKKQKITYTKNQKQILRILNNIIYQKDGDIKGLYLHGINQIGKTFLFLHFANELAKKHLKVIFLKITDLQKIMYDAIHDFKAQKTKEDLWVKIKECQVLFLDDLGAEKGNEYFYSNVLLPILDLFLTSNKWIFINSNYLHFEYLKKICNNPNDVKKNDLAKKIIKRIETLMKQNTLYATNKR